MFLFFASLILHSVCIIFAYAQAHFICMVKNSDISTIISEDEELLKAVQQNDRQAFDRLFIKYYPMLCAYCRQFTGFTEGEELVQELMVHFWEKRHEIRIDSTLSVYLFTAVRNRCLSGYTTLRRQERIRKLIFEELREQLEQPDYYFLRELSQKIQTALDVLPKTYREAFEMNRFEGLTYQQIAERLNVSSKTVDYRICQSLKILRKELQEYLPLLTGFL